MKKKIIFNAVVLVLSVALLASVSYALFTATTTISGNTLVNGTIEMTVRDPDTNELPLAFGKDPTKGTTVLRESNYNLQMENNELNLACGDKVSRVYEIKNTGTLDQYYRLYLKNVNIEGLGETEVNMKALLNKWYKITVKAANTHGSKITARDGVNFKSLTGANNAIAGLLNADDGKDYWRTIGTRATYTVEITLDKDAPNKLQGATVTFDVVMEAVQAANNYDFSKIPYSGYGGSNINIPADHQSQIAW